MFIVVGLTLLLIGSVLYITSSSISENEAIQRAARVTRGDDGQKMYTITGAEIHNATHRRNSMNADRANKRQIGVVLAVPGAILLIVSIAICKAPNKPAEIPQG
jgi:hypothetical protein